MTETKLWGLACPDFQMRPEPSEQLSGEGVPLDSCSLPDRLVSSGSLYSSAMDPTAPKQGASAPNDTPSPQAQPTSPSARQSRIRQSASESSAPINFARPLFSRSQGESEDADYFGSSTGADDADEANWRDEPSMSGSDRRALHASFSSDHFSRPSTPLKIRRRGMINDKKLTIRVGTSSSKSSSGRRVASDSATSASSELPARPAAAARALSHRSAKRAVDSSDSNMSMLSPRSRPASPRKNSSPKEDGTSPGSGLRSYMPFTPVKKSPLADKGHSPSEASTSPSSGSMPSSAEGSSNSGRSDKPLISGRPGYGFNPDFQLGSSGNNVTGSKLSPNTASPTSVRQGVSPVKPSPTFSGSSVGGVKSMLYSNQRNPPLPLSPRAPMYTQRSPGAAASKQQSMPRTPRTPKTPRTPRTPLTARLPNTPHSARPGVHTGGSYQGVLLTTITRAPSDPRVPTEGPLAESSIQASARKGRNRSASIATDILGFVRGGAAEVVPRLELRVLERQRQSQRYSLDINHVENEDKRAKRHSVAAVQSAQPRGSAPAGDVENGDEDDASPRSTSFARSAALSKLTGKRASTASVRAVRRTSEAPSISSRVGHRPYYKERRQTAATTASRVSGVSDRSRRSARSNLSRRVSMPVATVASLKSNRPSLSGRRLSLAPSSMRGRRDSSMQPDNSDSEDENDLLAELDNHVNNVADAKRWILGYRTQYDVTGPGVMGRDVEDNGRAVSAMRRPTYAASVFQQARLMEAERQAGAAFVSSSALDVANASAANLHVPGTPFPFGLPPRTPGFPKTPLTAFSTDAQRAGEADPSAGPQVLNAAEEPSWSDKTKYWLKAPFRFVARQVDPKYVLTMMDPREIILPITVRKVALWIVYGGLIAMLVLLDHYYHWWAKFDHAVHGKNLAIMGVLYGFEPAMILVIMLVARVPDARVVPDRTVLVPRARDSTDGESDADSRSSMSSDESVDDAQLATQMHSTIIEEEHTESEEEQGQDNESGIIDRDGPAAVRRASGLLKPPMRRMSTRFTANSGGSAAGPERRGSEGTTASGLAVPRTPMFDPRNRRSTIILHEPLNVGGLVDESDSRRPSAASVHHQIALARSVSRDSRRASYFSIVAAAAGSRLGAPSPSPAHEAVVVGDMNEKQDDADDEKKEAQLSDVKGDGEVRVAMDGVSHPSLTESTGLIIPCHNADVEVLKAVLFAALVHFEPWQIFIVDNGNTESPPTDMEGAIRSQPMFSRVNYIWLPVGNKNIAQFVGAKAAAKLDLDYVLTIDDDVIIPANFAAPMHIISPTVTATVAPETFLGPPVNGTGNYYHQRVRSWEMARHTLYWQFSKRFLFSLNGARTPVAIGWQKFTQFYNSITNFIDWIRLPMFVLLGGSGQFWLRSFAFIIFLPVLPLLPYRFIKTRNRPDLHPHMLDMLTFGVYKLLYSVVCILGGLRSMLVFFPNHSHKPNLIEMEKKGDKRCIWLRDDFMANSGGQGDLRDEPQQILVDEEVLEAAAVDEQEQEQDSAVVAALPEHAPQAQEMQEVAVVDVALPSRSREELPTVHENH
ncbi:hypothetical protein L1887_48246 [Cichorium endivia]|nr:hypothetical protein L1887_48246 [Cichorium endivia]